MLCHWNSRASICERSAYRAHRYEICIILPILSHLLKTILFLRTAFQYLKALAFLCALLTASNRIGAQIRIPVVVHIISQDPESVPDSRVLEGIADLNEAFSHTGRYAGGPGANTGISFCLAQLDPDGGISTGITRTRSPLANMDIDVEDRRLKNLIS